ncbi:MAG TPA: guanylate kinase [Burkholderiales bacterium]|nr:guanylate kinase [Burkholderiales bacterium]
MMGNLYIIWSPSGGGKTSLVAELTRRDPFVRHSVSHTTRIPRDGELEGRDYHFVDRPSFQHMVENGDFLEHAEVYGALYGTSQHWIKDTLAAGMDIFLTIDWQGGMQVRKIFPDLISIYVLPPSLAVLEQRLKNRRQDSLEVILKRLASAREDLSHLVEFDYVIINEDFSRAVDDLAAIVRARRLHRDAQLKRHQDLIQALMK